MSNEMITTDEVVTPTVQTQLGKDLNYSPFSSWYGKVKETLVSSNEITESLFFQALELLGAISRNGSQTLPPKSIYELMKGKNGQTKSKWYCKKLSTIAGRHVESYGICLEELEAFERKYLQKMVDILSEIEKQMADERAEVKLDLEAKREKLNTQFKDGKITREMKNKRVKRAEKAARGELREIREDIIQTVFKEFKPTGGE